MLRGFQPIKLLALFRTVTCFFCVTGDLC